ncbi:MAG: sialate O-acetylesterase, partial [Planctomycetota bacterium]|nr:sialate O-acetylesterase [Planctomycetota bacterium]
QDYHPAYDANVGYELAGFVWFQGFNDQFSEAFRNNYKGNMIHFIKDVRKEYKTPKMPFVIGVMGTSITKEKVAENAVSVAQREAAKAPEFKGTVTSVDSYLYYDLEAYEIYKKGWFKHLHEFSLLGSDRPYHYMGSGKFFTLFGDALAGAMNGLLKK